MHSHFLVLLGSLTDAQHKAVIDLIAANACSWFNYTPNAFLVCTTNDGHDLTGRLTNLLGQSTFYVVIAVDGSSTLGGAMPEDAWKWLRQHHLMNKV